MNYEVKKNPQKESLNFFRLNTGLQELAEGPLWHEGSFYWCNITGGEIWKWTPGDKLEADENNILLTEPERILKTGTSVGAFCFDADGRLIVLSEKGLELYEGEGRSRLIRPVSFRPGGRFNDCTMDKNGRIIAGTLYPELTGGELLSFRPDGRGGYNSPEILMTNIGISNGMAFTEDCRILYHTDTSRGTITSYEYLLNDGHLGVKKDIFIIDSGDGGPDGMTLDESGRLWTALWGGSGILSFSVRGGSGVFYECPAVQPSSIAFGGVPAGSRLVMLTTAAYGSDERSEKFRGGYVYIAEIETIHNN